jgi:hypothetical protein
MSGRSITYCPLLEVSLRGASVRSAPRDGNRGLHLSFRCSRSRCGPNPMRSMITVEFCYVAKQSTPGGASRALPNRFQVSAPQRRASEQRQAP